MSDTVNSSSCSYVSLNNYNSSSAGMLGSPPERETRPSTVRGYYIVPDYKPIQYNALTHGNAGPSCSGYFNITNGYGADAANCDTKYDFSPCGDGGGDIKEGFNGVTTLPPGASVPRVKSSLNSYNGHTYVSYDPPAYEAVRNPDGSYVQTCLPGYKVGVRQATGKTNCTLDDTHKQTCTSQKDVNGTCKKWTGGLANGASGITKFNTGPLTGYPAHVCCRNI